jgi:hypothetical protein
MSIAPAIQFFDLSLMPQIKSLELPRPPQSFRMMGVSLFAFSKDGPHGMKLSVFAQKVVSAQDFWMEIPNAHVSLLVLDVPNNTGSLVVCRPGKPQLIVTGHRSIVDGDIYGISLSFCSYRLSLNRFCDRMNFQIFNRKRHGFSGIGTTP